MNGQPANPIRPNDQLRRDAMGIWHAGVQAVDSIRLMRQHVAVDEGTLRIGDQHLGLDEFRHLVVVGAGKAGAGMAQALEEILGPDLLNEKRVAGCLNVPADCLRSLDRIQLQAARPAGVNEPTPDGVRGSARILELIENAHPDDLCICLLSGGGSALMPSPADGITLADKQRITRWLSAAGANIAELNTVRKALSKIKGGGLAARCKANRLITLIISDVLGDPLDVIASGPTVDSSTGKRDALNVLEHFAAGEADIGRHVFEFLRKEEQIRTDERQWILKQELVIGNNATAVDAAGLEAERRGYSHAMVAATKLEGPAEEIGQHLWRMAVRMRDQPGPDCLITGGEPIVELAPEATRGSGGRNQQLVLAALEAACRSHPKDENLLEGIVLLSGGTDGEDGPTDAAGAIIDANSVQAFRQRSLDIQDFLRRNDAYTFFEAIDGLIKTGPTHTNVCDLRVVVVERPELP